MTLIERITWSIATDPWLFGLVLLLAVAVGALLAMLVVYVQGAPGGQPVTRDYLTGYYTGRADERELQRHPHRRLRAAHFAQGDGQAKP